MGTYQALNTVRISSRNLLYTDGKVGEMFLESVCKLKFSTKRVDCTDVYNFILSTSSKYTQMRTAHSNFKPRVVKYTAVDRFKTRNGNEDLL